MTVFLYIRLSSADKDLKLKTESESISNQRKLLRRYIDTHPDLAGSIMEEFIDDGYSGTNADRPAFEQMIERIKNGDTDVIICKDFSRFFRDYVEIGDYLERIFPFLGVRFISVNDDYDSNEYKGTTAGMEVVMRYIVYSSYSHDLSKKTKTAIQVKQKRGQWVGSYAPYGYSKDKENKNNLVPNPDTAPVVKKIFDLALTGKKTGEIAVILNILKDCKYDGELANYVFVNDALMRIAQSEPMTGFVSAQGLKSNPDHLHFCAESLREFGLRYFTEFKKLEDKNKIFNEKPCEDDALRTDMELL